MSFTQKSQAGKLFGNQFITKKKISSGSFGVVYYGQDLKTKESVAIKVEKQSVDEMMSLEREVLILKTLAHVPQIPRLIWSQLQSDENVMVIQLLGKDLTYYLKQYRRFSLKCVLNIADQLLGILENIHKKSVLHRDIKPENVLLGRDGEQSLLYLVDFGISKVFRDSKGQHIPSKKGKPFLGTTRYASIEAHRGHELGRKDDLESLGYMLIFLLKGVINIIIRIKGQLPWQSLHSDNEEERTKLVGEMKMKMDLSELCKDLPMEFARYLDFVKKLSFKSSPDYKYLQQMFKKLSINSNFNHDERKFDWSESQPIHSLLANVTSESQFRATRRQSIDPSSLLVNNLGQIQDKRNNKSSNLSNNRLSSFNHLQNDQEMNSAHSVLNLSKGSFLQLPEKQQQQQVERRANRVQSTSSFNSINSSKIAQENSCMVGFQPSLQVFNFKLQFSLGTVLRQISQTQQSIKEKSSKQSPRDKEDQSEINENDLQIVELVPSPNYKKKIQPINQYHQSTNIFTELCGGSRNSYQNEKNQQNQGSFTMIRQVQLNEDEKMDLSDKYLHLGQLNIQKKFKPSTFQNSK